MPRRRRPSPGASTRVAPKVGAAVVNYNWTHAAASQPAAQHASDGPPHDDDGPRRDAAQTSPATWRSPSNEKGTVTVRPFSARSPPLCGSALRGDVRASSSHGLLSPPPHAPRLSRGRGLRDEKWVRKLKLALADNPADEEGFDGPESAREKPCSLEDVKALMREGGEKGGGYKVHLNSPRSVITCLLSAIDPNTLIPRKVMPSRDIYPYSEYETRKQERVERRRRAVNDMRMQTLLERREALTAEDVARYRLELTGVYAADAEEADDVSVEEHGDDTEGVSGAMSAEAAAVRAAERAAAKDAAAEAKRAAEAEEAAKATLAAMAEAEKVVEEGLAELAELVAQTVKDEGDDEDGYPPPPLRVPTLGLGGKRAKKEKHSKRPSSARAARLSKLTESELLPPRPHSARASPPLAAAHLAAAEANKRKAHPRHAAAAAGLLLKKDALGTSGRVKKKKASKAAPGSAWMKPPVPTFKVRRMPPVPSFPTGADVSGWPYLESGTGGRPKGKIPRAAKEARIQKQPSKTAKAASAAEPGPFTASEDTLEKLRILERLVEERAAEAAVREAQSLKVTARERELRRAERERVDAARLRREEDLSRASARREARVSRQFDAEEARLATAEGARLAVQLETRERFAVVDVGDPSPHGFGGRATSAVLTSPERWPWRNGARPGSSLGTRGSSFLGDGRQAAADHKAEQRARLDVIERRERAAFEEAASKLKALRIAKARDEREAAVLAAQEKKAAINEARAAEFARRREALSQRREEEADANRRQMALKLRTVQQRREAIEEAQAAALRRRAERQDEARAQAALARARAEADDAERRAEIARRRREKFELAEAKVEARLLGETLERGAKLEAAEDLHALRMRELSRREALRAEQVKAKIAREEETAAAAREKRALSARRQKMRVEKRAFGVWDDVDPGGFGKMGADNKAPSMAGPSGSGVHGAWSYEIDIHGHPNRVRASLARDIMREAAAKNQGLEEMRDEMRAKLEEERARAAEANLNAAAVAAERTLNGGRAVDTSQAAGRRTYPAGPPTTEFGLEPAGDHEKGSVPVTTPGGGVARFVTG